MANITIQFNLDFEADDNSVPTYHFNVNNGDVEANQIYLVTQLNDLDLTTEQMDTVAAAAKAALEEIATTVTQTEVWYTDS